MAESFLFLNEFWTLPFLGVASSGLTHFRGWPVQNLCYHLVYNPKNLMLMIFTELAPMPSNCPIAENTVAGVLETSGPRAYC